MYASTLQIQYYSEASSNSGNIPLGCTELPIVGLLLKYQQQVLLGTPTVKQTPTLSILNNHCIEVAISYALNQPPWLPQGPTNIKAFYLGQSSSQHHISSTWLHRFSHKVLQHVGRMLYLARHNFSIDATDLNASIQASLIMSIHNITPPSFVSSSPTVVGSLFPDVYAHIRRVNICGKCKFSTSTHNQYEDSCNDPTKSHWLIRKDNFQCNTGLLWQMVQEVEKRDLNAGASPLCFETCKTQNEK
jgi:hypothetical protein